MIIFIIIKILGRAGRLGRQKNSGMFFGVFFLMIFLIFRSKIYYGQAVDQQVDPVDLPVDRLAKELNTLVYVF